MKYPHMRNELLEHLRALADKNYQKAVWVRGESRPDVVHDEMDYAVHFIYDDTCLGSNPNEAIGWYLKDETEANAIHTLVNTLDTLFSKYGKSLTDDEYLQKPEWENVVLSAMACRDLLLTSN